MTKVLLIDADSTIPNIPLMKLSMFHKRMGDHIDFIKLNMPYYPNRKKKIFRVIDNYDKIYCSVIFEGNKEYIKGDNIIFGGTGVDLETNLPEKIEKLPPDYSLYPNCDTSYGFITRGCIRNCSFCKVPKKEGMIRQVSDIDSIIYHKKVKFLDNNILALPTHKDILQELVLKNIRCQFNQGLDIRLIDNENSELLSRLNYIGEYIFAFDDIAYKKIIKTKLKLLDWRKDWKFKFFVYIHPKMSIQETVLRVEWLKENKCLPYIMRDISCWGSVYSNFYVDLAAYCNQVNLFKKLSFHSFLEKRHGIKGVKRIENSSRLYNENL